MYNKYNIIPTVDDLPIKKVRFREEFDFNGKLEVFSVEAYVAPELETQSFDHEFGTTVHNYAVYEKIDESYIKIPRLNLSLKLSDLPATTKEEIESRIIKLAEET